MRITSRRLDRSSWLSYGLKNIGLVPWAVNTPLLLNAGLVIERDCARLSLLPDLVCVNLWKDMHRYAHRHVYRHVRVRLSAGPLLRPSD